METRHGGWYIVPSEWHDELVCAMRKRSPSPSTVYLRSRMNGYGAKFVVELNLRFMTGHKNAFERAHELVLSDIVDMHRHRDFKDNSVPWVPKSLLPLLLDKPFKMWPRKESSAIYLCLRDFVQLPAAQIARLQTRRVLDHNFFRLYFKYNRVEATIFLHRSLVLNQIDGRTHVYLPTPTLFPVYFHPNAEQARQIILQPNNRVPRAWMLQWATTATPSCVEATLHHFAHVGDVHLLLVLMWNCRWRYLNFIRQYDGALGKAYYLYWAGGHLKLEGLVLHRVMGYLGYM